MQHSLREEEKRVSLQNYTAKAEQELESLPDLMLDLWGRIEDLGEQDNFISWVAIRLALSHLNATREFLNQSWGNEWTPSPQPSKEQEQTNA
jgi:hypothetical protein